jgi:hypothetical protein
MIEGNEGWKPRAGFGWMTNISVIHSTAVPLTLIGMVSALARLGRAVGEILFRSERELRTETATYNYYYLVDNCSSIDINRDDYVWLA